MITAAKVIILFHSAIVLPQILIKMSKKRPLRLFAIAQFITHTIFNVVVDDKAEQNVFIPRGKCLDRGYKVISKA